MTILDHDWEGYLINHILPKDHPHYMDGDRFPGDINWISFNPNFTLVTQEIDVKFLRIGKLFYLKNDPDDLSELLVDIPILLELYDYGNWNYNLPEKQDKKVYFFKGVIDPIDYNHEAILDRDNFKLIRRSQTSQQKEKIVSGRRKDAFDYLKARGKEIDFATNHTLKLDETIKNFFDGYYNEYARYVESGSIAIIDLLRESNEAWLQIDLPNLGTIQNEIIRILEQALVIPATEEIELEIEKYLL